MTNPKRHLGLDQNYVYSSPVNIRKWPQSKPNTLSTPKRYSLIHSRFAVTHPLYPTTWVWPKEYQKPEDQRFFLDHSRCFPLSSFGNILHRVKYGVYVSNQGTLWKENRWKCLKCPSILPWASLPWTSLICSKTFKQSSPSEGEHCKAPRCLHCWAEFELVVSGFGVIFCFEGPFFQGSVAYSSRTTNHIGISRKVFWSRQVRKLH